MKNPPTSSDSASTRSKGVLFTSANPDIKNIRNTGINGTANQIEDCDSIIEIKLKELANISAANAEPPNTNS